MYEYDYQFFLPTDILEVDPKTMLSESKNTQNQDDTFTSHLKSYDFSSNKHHKANQTTLDVLIMWTEEARVGSGGNAGNINDTADIDALMVTAIDHANTSLSNSSMNTRLTRFHTAKYNGFTYTGNFTTQLASLKNNLAISNLRDQVGADTVIAIIGHNPPLFGACGVAYVQTYPGCSANDPQAGCAVGASFKASSYSIATEFCAIADDTFTHELGHNMGANHAPGESGSSWDLAVINNGYPDAFGHRTIGFKSIMSISPPTSARLLHFSNPNVQFNGINTGISGSRNNANLIDQLTPVMSNFGTRPDSLFSDGFE